MSEWTTDKPTEPGYYWWKQGNRIEPCEICRVGDTLEARFIGEANSLRDWQWQPDWQWSVCDEIEQRKTSEREGWRYADELEQERKRLTALNKQWWSSSEALALRVLGQDRYDNSAAQANPLELVEQYIAELEATRREQ